ARRQWPKGARASGRAQRSSRLFHRSRTARLCRRSRSPPALVIPRRKPAHAFASACATEVTAMAPDLLRRLSRQRAALFLSALAVLAPAHLLGEPVSVRFTEGIVHGFLSLRTLDGAVLANGDLIQTAHGDRVTARLTFRFKDGSIHDETAVFSQRQVFRLVSDHLVQKGT